MRALTELEKAYLACAIDTEGCIIESTRLGKPMTRILVTNTNKAFLEKLREITGIGYIYTRWHDQNVRHSLCFEWHVNRRKEVIDLSKAILEYLIIKKAKASIIIERYKNYTDYRKAPRFKEILAKRATGNSYWKLRKTRNQPFRRKSTE